MADGAFHPETRAALNLNKMKTTNYFLLILAACSLAFGGCKKSEAAASVPQFHGVSVDLPKLDTEFATVGPELQESLSMVKRFFRYGQVPQALMELDKLSNNPGLTEPQKKLIKDLIEQPQQVIMKASA